MELNRRQFGAKLLLMRVQMRKFDPLIKHDEEQIHLAQFLKLTAKVDL